MGAPSLVDAFWRKALKKAGFIKIACEPEQGMVFEERTPMICEPSELDRKAGPPESPLQEPLVFVFEAV